MTAFPIRWLPYLLAGEFLVALFFQPQVFAQEAGEKPEAPMPKAMQAAIPFLRKPAETLPQKSTEPEPERVPDLPRLATRLLEYAEVIGCLGKDCGIFVANFVLPDGNTSKYGIQLADELSREMASRRSALQIVDRELARRLSRQRPHPREVRQGRCNSGVCLSVLGRIRSARHDHQTSSRTGAAFS